LVSNVQISPAGFGDPSALTRSVYGTWITLPSWGLSGTVLPEAMYTFGYAPCVARASRIITPLRCVGV